MILVEIPHTVAAQVERELARAEVASDALLAGLLRAVEARRVAMARPLRQKRDAAALFAGEGI